MLIFLLVPLYTRVLSTEEFAVAEIVLTASFLLYPVLTLTIAEAVLRFALDNAEDKGKIFTVSMLILILATSLLSIVMLFVNISNNFNEYKYLLVALFVFTSYYSIVSQFSRGVGLIIEVGIAGVLNTFVLILSNVILLIVFNQGTFGYLFSIIISNAVSSLYLSKKCNAFKFIRKEYVDFKILDKMMKFSIPMVPNSVSWWIITASDRYMVASFIGLGAAGVYSVAFKIPSMLTVLSSVFMQAWQISAIKEFDSKDKGMFYTEIYQLYSAFLMIICSLIIMLSKYISFVLFSLDFFSAWIYVPVLMIAFVFNGLSAYLGTIYTSAKATKMLFYSTITGAIFNIILNFYFIPKLGVMGAAIATLLSYFLIWLIRLINSSQFLKIEINIFRTAVGFILLFLQSIVVINLENSLFICFLLLVLIILLNFKYLRIISEKFVWIKKN